MRTERTISPTKFVPPFSIVFPHYRREVSQLPRTIVTIGSRNFCNYGRLEDGEASETRREQVDWYNSGEKEKATTTVEYLAKNTRCITVFFFWRANGANLLLSLLLFLSSLALENFYFCIPFVSIEENWERIKELSGIKRNLNSGGTRRSFRMVETKFSPWRKGDGGKRRARFETAPRNVINLQQLETFARQFKSCLIICNLRYSDGGTRWIPTVRKFLSRSLWL